VVRGGFALPVVLMALFILTGALASGFAMLRGERAADDATLQADAAAALAETGLQQGLNNRAGLGLSALPGVTPDSARLTLAGGYVDVITTRLREPVGEAVPGLYFVRTRGVRTRAGVSGAGNAVATASSFATYQIITMTVQSAMTGINGINKAGGAGVISGFDVCGQKPPLPAVAVPTDPGMTGSGPFLNTLEGSTKISEIGGTKAQAADAVPIDWDAIVNDNAIAAQYDLPASGAGFPEATWWAANPLAWPTIIVRNGPDPSTEFVLPTKGRGLLIIFGDLNLNGNAAGWDGLVLVGGRLRSNGANEVQGGTITGLNVKLGFNVEDNDVNELNGTKEYKYNSCHIASALNGSGGGSLRPYQSTFANSFPTY
jgi:hypothetical protein